MDFLLSPEQKALYDSVVAFRDAVDSRRPVTPATGTTLSATNDSAGPRLRVSTVSVPTRQRSRGLPAA